VADYDITLETKKLMKELHELINKNPVTMKDYTEKLQKVNEFINGVMGKINEMRPETTKYPNVTLYPLISIFLEQYETTLNPIDKGSLTLVDLISIVVEKMEKEQGRINSNENKNDVNKNNINELLFDWKDTISQLVGVGFTGSPPTENATSVNEFLQGYQTINEHLERERKTLKHMQDPEMGKISPTLSWLGYNVAAVIKRNDFNVQHYSQTEQKAIEMDKRKKEIKEEKKARKETRKVSTSVDEKSSIAKIDSDAIEKEHKQLVNDVASFVLKVYELSQNWSSKTYADILEEKINLENRCKDIQKKTDPRSTSHFIATRLLEEVKNEFETVFQQLQKNIDHFSDRIDQLSTKWDPEQYFNLRNEKAALINRCQAIYEKPEQYLKEINDKFDSIPQVKKELDKTKITSQAPLPPKAPPRPSTSLPQAPPQPNTSLPTITGAIGKNKHDTGEKHIFKRLANSVKNKATKIAREAKEFAQNISTSKQITKPGNENNAKQDAKTSDKQKPVNGNAIPEKGGKRKSSQP